MTSGVWATIWGPAYPVIKMGLAVTLLGDLGVSAWHKVLRTLTLDHQLSHLDLIAAFVFVLAVIFCRLVVRYRRTIRSTASWAWWLLAPFRFFLRYTWWILQSLLLVPVWLVIWMVPLFFSGLVMAVWFAGYSLLFGSVHWFEDRPWDKSTTVQPTGPPRSTTPDKSRRPPQSHGSNRCNTGTNQNNQSTRPAQSSRSNQNNKCRPQSPGPSQNNHCRAHSSEQNPYNIQSTRPSQPPQSHGPSQHINQSTRPSSAPNRVNQSNRQPQQSSGSNQVNPSTSNQATRPSQSSHPPQPTGNAQPTTRGRSGSGVLVQHGRRSPSGKGVHFAPESASQPARHVEVIKVQTNPEGYLWGDLYFG